MMNKSRLNTYKSGPNEKGFFGEYGGQYVAETLMPLIQDLENETSSESKQQYLIAKSKLEALNSSHYEKI